MITRKLVRSLRLVTRKLVRSLRLVTRKLVRSLRLVTRKLVRSVIHFVHEIAMLYSWMLHLNIESIIRYR